MAENAGKGREIPVEIERKYLARMPHVPALACMEGYTVSDMEQAYLAAAPGTTHRVRARTSDGKTRFYETKKRRIDGMSAEEDEREITVEEYTALFAARDPARRVIYKKRYTFIYKNQLFEVDIYPFWTKQCVVETELPRRDMRAAFPSVLTVIREVTGDSRYSNAALSKEIPPEDETEATPI